MSNNNKWQKPTPENRYAWEAAYEIINRFVREVDTVYFTRAWVLMQRLLEAIASGYRPDEPADVALAMAWEDFEMACRGRGMPIVAGGFFQMCSRLPSSFDARFALVLGQAFEATLAKTDPRVLRYPAGLRQGEMATLKKNYARGEAEPVDDARWHYSEPSDMFAWLEEAHPELQPAPPPLQLVLMQGGLSDKPPTPKVIRRRKQQDE